MAVTEYKWLLRGLHAYIYEAGGGARGQNHLIFGQALGKIIRAKKLRATSERNWSRTSMSTWQLRGIIPPNLFVRIALRGSYGTYLRDVKGD